MKIYGNPGSGFEHKNPQPTEIEKETVNPKGKKIRVDGLLYLTIKEATAATGISKETLKKYANSGKPHRGHEIRWEND